MLCSRSSALECWTDSLCIRLLFHSRAGGLRKVQVWTGAGGIHYSGQDDMDAPPLLTLQFDDKHGKGIKNLSYKRHHFLELNNCKSKDLFN